MNFSSSDCKKICFLNSYPSHNPSKVSTKYLSDVNICHFNTSHVRCKMRFIDGSKNNLIISLTSNIIHHNQTFHKILLTLSNFRVFFEKVVFFEKSYMLTTPTLSWNWNFGIDSYLTNWRITLIECTLSKKFCIS